jgi:hypothetical protein
MDSKTSSKKGSGSGYEYRVVGHCARTGRPFVTPIVWSHRQNPRRIYATCLCCKP